MDYRVQILNPTVPDNVKYFDTLEELNEFTSDLDFPHRSQKLVGNNYENIATR